METATPEYKYDPTYEVIGELKPPKRYGGNFPIKSITVDLVPNLGVLERFTVLGRSSKGEHIGKLSICKKPPKEETPTTQESGGDQQTEKPDPNPNPIYSTVPECILAETTNTDRENPFQVVHVTGEFPEKDLVWDESFTAEEIRLYLKQNNIYVN